MVFIESIYITIYQYYLNLNHSTDLAEPTLLILILIKLFVFCKVIIFPKEEHY
jgi:hypothetical protein